MHTLYTFLVWLFFLLWKSQSKQVKFESREFIYKLLKKPRDKNKTHKKHK